MQIIINPCNEIAPLIDEIETAITAIKVDY